MSEGCGTGRCGRLVPDETWVEVGGGGRVSVSSVGADPRPEKLIVMLGIRGAGVTSVAEGGKTAVCDRLDGRGRPASSESSGGGTASATDQHDG